MSQHHNLKQDDPSIIQCTKATKSTQDVLNNSRKDLPADGKQTPNSKKTKSSPKPIQDNKGNFSNNGANKAKCHQFGTPPMPTRLHPQAKNVQHLLKPKDTRSGFQGNHKSNERTNSGRKQNHYSSSNCVEKKPPSPTGTIIDSLVSHGPQPLSNGYKDSGKKSSLQRTQNGFPQTSKLDNPVASRPEGKKIHSNDNISSNKRDSSNAQPTTQSVQAFKKRQRRKKKKNKVETPTTDMEKRDVQTQDESKAKDLNPGQKILGLINKNINAGTCEIKAPNSVAEKEKANASSPKTESNPQEEYPVEPEPIKQEAIKKSEMPSVSLLKQDEKSEKEKPSPEKTVENITSKMEELGMDQAVARLNKDYIYLLKKKSTQFPAAKFLCNLCNYHLDTVNLAHRHIKEKRHKKLLKEKKQDELLKKTALPSDQAIEALHRLLVDKVLKDSVLDEDDMRKRKRVVQVLDELIGKQMKGSKVVMYGSSYSGLGFKHSDLNVDLQYPESIRAPNALMRVLEILEGSKEKYSDVKADFRAKIPRIDFVDVSASITVSLSTNNEFAVNTTRLLRLYSLLDPRVTQLCMVFRSWAQICKLDRQHEGSLPQYSFALMAIFFLQRRKYLPVLHKIIAEHDMNEIISTSITCPQIVTKGDSYWYIPTPKPSAVGRPFESMEEATEDSDVDSDIEADASIEFLDDGDSPEVIFEKADSKERKASSSDPESFKPVELMGECTGRETPLALLWLQMLKFFALEYNIEDLVISVKHSSDLRREEKGWGKKRIAILDPYATKRNLCRSMCSQNVFSFMMQRLKSALVYFHTDPTKSVSKSVSDDTNKLSSQSDHDVIKALVGDLLEKLEVGSEDGGQTIKSDGVSLAENSGTNLKDDSNETKTDSGQPQSTLGYKFNRDVLTGGENPVVVCGVCKKEGHARTKCPEEIEQLHLEPLPAMTSQLRDMLDRVCRAVMGFFKPNKDEVRMREQICIDLNNYLKRSYDTRCVMKLFGSSKNGFGFKGSDLDICLTFDDNNDGKGIDFVAVIESVTKCLRRNYDLCAILPITTAKVPIVKFEHRHSNLEGDISLYNLLAQRNTLMLSSYANIDERCRILGYVTKAFVKKCHIGDASRGSLSSYAYTLMVIFYLQQRSPPVLPVLQQLGPDHENQSAPIDGWNSWFYDDLNKLGEVWAEQGENKESVGELWLGLIRFYTETFDFRKHVVSIRQKKLLTTFEKEWTSKFISIEDPFDLNHNLGAGVSRKMTNFIMRVFVKARHHFGIAPNLAAIRGGDLVNYFFDAHVLMDGEEAPNDRCCRICGKIGHFVRTCPKNRRRRRNDAEDEDSMNEVVCFYCSGKGHIKKDCPVLKEVNSQKTPLRRGGENPNMGTRMNNATRNSPMSRRNTPSRNENLASDFSNQNLQNSHDNKRGKVNKNLNLGQIPTSSARNPDAFSRHQSPRDSRSNAQQAPFGSGASELQKVATPPKNPVQSKNPHPAQWSPYSPHARPPGLGRLPNSHSNKTHRYPTVGNSPHKMLPSAVEAQIFHKTAQERQRKCSESGSNSEQPSPRPTFAANSPPGVAVVPAAPMLGMGLRIPNPSGGFQRSMNPSPFSPTMPPYPYSPTASPQNASIPFSINYGGQSPRSAHWNNAFFHHGNE